LNSIREDNVNVPATTNVPENGGVGQMAVLVMEPPAGQANVNVGGPPNDAGWLIVNAVVAACTVEVTANSAARVSGDDGPDGEDGPGDPPHPAITAAPSAAARKPRTSIRNPRDPILALINMVGPRRRRY
jgi:hypothetical protein